MARWKILLRCMALMSVFAYQAVPSSPTAVAQTVAQDGMSVKIAGRSMRCGQTPIIMDNEIPSEGLSVPGEALYLNPFLLKLLPTTVRLFIFKHECAHETTGPDELGADCMAAKAGAREGWLKVGDIDAVCRSFAGPATETHPSGKSRCANIRRCYAGTQVASTRPAATAEAKTSSWSSSEVSSAEQSGREGTREANTME
ncbi:MAG: hypothetical protein ACXW6R_24505 [Candidatus Binatia bacterium]